MSENKPAPSKAHAQLQKVVRGAPLDIVAVDVLSGLPSANDGSKYSMVLKDYFTKWSESYALPDAEAHTCMSAMYNNFFARFGMPRQLHSDKGKNFESKINTISVSLQASRNLKQPLSIPGQMGKPNDLTERCCRCCVLLLLIM